MPLQATSGAASYDAFGGGVPVVPAYIEEVFSCFLYTGNGSTQTITNGIDLSTKGGLVWFKSRSGTYGTQSHVLTSNELTNWTNYLSSNTTGDTAGLGATAFTPSTTGFALNSVFAGINDSGTNYASWTFRKQPKFFDVVTYTGDGSSPRAISHSLGSAPGCVIIKQTDVANDWCVWHTATGNDKSAALNLTNAFGTFAQRIKSVTSTTFSVGNSSTVNDSGATYVAYLFAHDAGGFGLTGTDNVISCGSYTGNGSATGPVVTLGYEPQWILIKDTTDANEWHLFDTMRGIATGGIDPWLEAQSSGAEQGSDNMLSVLATGFQPTNATPRINTSGAAYIYIAIRRGPMKVPTSGNEVFYSAAFGDEDASFPTGFVTDFAINKVTYYNPASSTYTSGGNYLSPRLAGVKAMQTNSTNVEGSSSAPAGWDIQDGYKWANGSGYQIFGWAFKRAPSFADVVCYTGTGSNTTVTHNLGAVPELIFVKRRDTAAAWDTYCSALANTEYLVLNTTAAKATGATRWNSTTPTSSVFSVGTSTTTNASAGTYVAYLFSTCAGVSKVGGYTGTGSTQTINCGFAASARFILIKRTNTTGNWFVYDSYRGIQSGNDPYLLLNDSAAAVLNTDYVAADSTGFQVIGTGLNVNAATYIFLAIA